MAESQHYKARYGQWAGNSHGQAPDFSRCCKTLRDKYHPGGYQCTRKSGFGPDEAYCKQHDPKSVESRQVAAKERYDAQWRGRKIEMAGPRFLAVLRQIAEGHNDPRTLAIEAIAPFQDKPAPPQPSRQGEDR